LQGASMAIRTPFGERPVNGDIITAVNGQPVTQMNDLIAYLEDNTRPGDTVTLTVWRDGAQVEVPITLGERPHQIDPQREG
jgi:S1-C subfamily serine protease